MWGVCRVETLSPFTDLLSISLLLCHTIYIVSLAVNLENLIKAYSNSNSSTQTEADCTHKDKGWFISNLSMHGHQHATDACNWLDLQLGVPRLIS